MLSKSNSHYHLSTEYYVIIMEGHTSVYHHLILLHIVVSVYMYNNTNIRH
jgi:hypothetical protein